MEIKAELNLKGGELTARITNGKDKTTTLTARVQIEEDDKIIFREFEDFLKRLDRFCPEDYRYDKRGIIK